MSWRGGALGGRRSGRERFCSDCKSLKAANEADFRVNPRPRLEKSLAAPLEKPMRWMASIDGMQAQRVASRRVNL